MDTCGDLAAIFHKGDNFCDFLFASPFEKVSTL